MEPATQKTTDNPALLHIHSIKMKKIQLQKGFTNIKMNVQYLVMSKVIRLHNYRMDCSWEVDYNSAIILVILLILVFSLQMHVQ